LCNDAYPRACAEGELAKATDKDRMKTEMAKMKVVARAKVTTDRIYSMAYHPEKVRSTTRFRS
jgi:anthranilate/para-aminobenzoate synthase component II